MTCAVPIVIEPPTRSNTASEISPEVSGQDCLTIPSEAIGSTSASSFIETADAVESFFTEDDGRSLLPPSIYQHATSTRSAISLWRAISTPSIHSPSLWTTASPAMSRLSLAYPPYESNLDESRTSLSIFRNFSSHSINTLPIAGILCIELLNLCDMINANMSLRQAEILTTECYTQKVAAGVLHRFLVLELRRKGRKNVWLRLDRRAGRSALSLVRALGSSPANDIAQISSEKGNLLGAGKLENQQIFTTKPTLGELEHFLRIICDELKDYQVWPANCWFFCSLVQEHLEGTNKGEFALGALPYRKLASDIRDRVNERLRLFYHAPMPFSLAELLRSMLRIETNKELLSELWVVLELCLKRDHNEATASNQTQVQLGVSLHNLAKKYYAIKAYDDAGFLLKECVSLFDQLHRTNTRKNALNLAIALSSQSIYFHDSSKFSEACDAQSRAISLVRRLHEREPEKHRVMLADILYNHGVTLQAMGPSMKRKASVMAEEAIEIRRKLYEAQPDSKSLGADLAAAIHSHAAYLHSARLFDQAVEAASEVVSLRRRQMAAPSTASSSSNTRTSSLEDHLGHHSLALQFVLPTHDQFYSDSLPVADIQVTRMGMYVRRMALCMYSSGSPLRRTVHCDPVQESSDLASALCNLGAALHNAKRSKDACRVNEEAVGILNTLQEADRGKVKSGESNYVSVLLRSLSNHALSLRAIGRYEEARAVDAQRKSLLA